MSLPTCLTDFSNVSNVVEKIAFGLWFSVHPISSQSRLESLNCYIFQG